MRLDRNETKIIRVLTEHDIMDEQCIALKAHIPTSNVRVIMEQFENMGYACRLDDGWSLTR